MALADVLRQRVSRRGRTAQVECGALGTVTVEALPPRECAALGMADGGRALLYAACRELQAAGEALRRERRLFTPDEVTQYVSDSEARTAARTVLALSGVTLNKDEAVDQDGKADNETDKPESPDKSDETEHLSRTDEKNVENRLETVHESVQQMPEVRPENVQFPEDTPAEPQAEREEQLETVHKTVQQMSEIRHGNVQFLEDTPEDGQVSREFSGDGKSVRATPSVVADLDFAPQNLALSEKNDNFMSPLELSEENEEVSGRMVEVLEIESEVQEPLHEITSELAANKQQAPHEITSEFREPLHETESDFLNTPHETKSEIDENRRGALHKTTSELAEQVAQRLLEGLRRAAAVR